MILSPSAHIFVDHVLQPEEEIRTVDGSAVIDIYLVDHALKQDTQSRPGCLNEESPVINTLIKWPERNEM